MSYSKKRLNELRELCHSRGLDTQGQKKELIDRLQAREENVGEGSNRQDPRPNEDPPPLQRESERPTAYDDDDDDGEDHHDAGSGGDDEVEIPLVAQESEHLRIRNCNYRFN